VGGVPTPKLKAMPATHRATTVTTKPTTPPPPTPHATPTPRAQPTNRTRRLLTSDAGHEIYLRHASAFGLPPAGRSPKPLTWLQVSEAVRAKGQTAVGVAPAAGGPGALRLAPAAADLFELTADDEIVVIARQ